MQTEHEYPQPILDTQYGYAINIPLSEQEPVEFWATPKGAEIRQYIEERRKAYGLHVDDHLVTVQGDPDETTDSIQLLRNSLKTQNG